MHKAAEKKKKKNHASNISLFWTKEEKKYTHLKRKHYLFRCGS